MSSIQLKIGAPIMFALALLTSCWFRNGDSGSDTTLASPTVVAAPSAPTTPESMPQIAKSTQIVAVTEELLTSPSITPEHPSATPLPLVPWVPSENAQIQIPNPVSLLRGLDLLLDNPAVPSSRVNLTQLGTELVVEDLKRYYPNGVPHAAGLDLSSNLLWASPELVRLILQTRVVQYLNSLSLDLVAEPFHSSWAYQVEAHPMSDIDETINLLLVVRNQQQAPYSYIDLLVPVEVEAGEKYSLVENDLPFYIGPNLYAPTTVVYSQLHFSDSSSAEFLIHQYGHRGGSHNYYDFYLFDWGKESVFTLDDIDILFNLLEHEEFYPQYAIGDFVDNSHTDLKIMRTVKGYFGCRHLSETIYSWSDEGFVALDSEIPDTPECNAHQWYLSQPQSQPAEARAFLMRAIAQWSLEPPPSEELLTFLQLQLVFAQGSLGEQYLAEQSFAELLERPPSQAFGGLFAEYAATHDRLNVPELCALINEHIVDADYSEINPYMYSPRYSTAYSLDNYGCNQSALIESLVHNLEIPMESKPADVLRSAGLDTAQFNQLDLEGDGSPEWAGIIELSRSTLFVIWQAKEMHWHPTFIDLIPDTFAPIGGLEAIARDFNNDGLPDIGYLHSIVGQECETGFRLVINAWPGDRDDQEIHYELGCGVRSLADFEFADSDFVLPDWYMLSGFGESDQTLPDLLADLTYRVSAQSEQELNAAIINKLFDYLPSDSNELQLIVEFLYYLRGLNYELMGDEKMAVHYYLMLLELSRESPWSWMTAARLRRAPFLTTPLGRPECDTHPAITEPACP